MASLYYSNYKRRWIVSARVDGKQQRRVFPTREAAQTFADTAGLPDTQNQTEARCPRCDGRNGHHGLVHVRHGNGGGHNEPCPETPRDANDG